MNERWRIGLRVVVHSGPPDDGQFAGRIDGFTSNGHVMIVQPEDPALRLWFTTGYRIGSAHWGTAVVPHPAQPTEGSST